MDFSAYDGDRVPLMQVHDLPEEARLIRLTGRHLTHLHLAAQVPSRLWEYRYEPTHEGYTWRSWPAHGISPYYVEHGEVISREVATQLINDRGQNWLRLAEGL